MAIKLFDRCFQVGLVLKFHETFAIATSLGVDNVDLSLTCKVF